MSDNEFIKEIEFTHYDDFVGTIHGRSKKCGNLRDKFIFKCIEDSKFQQTHLLFMEIILIIC